MPIADGLPRTDKMARGRFRLRDIPAIPCAIFGVLLGAFLTIVARIAARALERDRW